MAKPTLSLSMIVRDVAPFIVSCLESVIHACDEVVVTDTGSTDETKNVLAKFFSEKAVKYQILDFNPQTHPDAFMIDDSGLATTYGAPPPFSGNVILADFAAARQFGWDKCTSDFVLWIDSDDLVHGAEKIAPLLERMEREQVDYLMVDYEYDHDATGRPICLLNRERLVRRQSKYAGKWAQPIHEVFCSDGPRLFIKEFKIVHRRSKLLPAPKIPNRNLKVLLRQYHRAKQAGDDKVDPRTLFYLGMEWRMIDEEKSLPYLREYIKKSGWDEERALAHLWLGLMYERKGDHEAAFLEYSACATEFPWHPDGIFGCARSFYFRKDWSKCVDFTERAQKIMANEQERKSVLQHNPLDRNFFPLQFVSKALIEIGRVKDAVEVCKRGLAIVPDDDILSTNLKVCVEWLAQQEKPPEKGSQISIPLEDPLATPARDLPKQVLAAFAVQLWKKVQSANTPEGWLQAQTLLDSLPAEIRELDRIKEAVRMTAGRIQGQPQLPVEPTEIEKLKIVIWTGPAWEKWSPKTIKTGIGGSETAACYMAWELQKRGHKVTVYSDVGDDEGTYDGVEFLQYQKAQDGPDQIHCDVLIVSRQPWILDLPFHAKVRFLWVHDIHVGGRSDQLIAQLARANKILCLSEWHKKFFLEMYPSVPPDQVIVTRNGIDVARYSEEPVKNGNKLIFSSSANRGLDVALDLLPRIRAEVPNAELHVYYGFDTWRAYAEAHSRHELPEIEALEKKLNETEGAVSHGRVGQQALAKAQLESKLWFYPTAFTETSCISAMEAQAAGAVPMTSAIAALEETVHHGILIRGHSRQPDYQDLIVKETVELLTDETKRKRFADAGRKEALKRHPWWSVAAEWNQLFLDLLAQKSPTEIASLQVSLGERDVQEIKIEDQKKYRLAFTYGFYSSSLHGKFDIPSIYERQGLTGSESSFFNMVKALCEMGHVVDVFCDTTAHYAAQSELAGAHVYPLWTTVGTDYDAYVVWNEPDLLRKVPPNALRVCFQQLNDFRNYSKQGWDEFVDLYVFPSDTHRKYVCQLENISLEKTIIIANSVNLDFYMKTAPSRDKSIVWCSSPDRGLHVMLDVFPLVRRRVPDAVLKIFYRFERWYETAKDLPDESGNRARKIHEQLNAQGKYGQNGVILLDQVSNRKIAQELLSSGAYAYTCEPIQFTEGFSVSTMDACAAGIPAVISDADALPELYREGPRIVAGKPSEYTDYWAEQIADLLTNDQTELVKREKALAAKHDRRIIARQFLKILPNALEKKK